MSMSYPLTLNQVVVIGHTFVLCENRNDVTNEIKFGYLYLKGILISKFFLYKISTRYFTLNSEKQWSSLTFPLSLHLSCQVVVLFLS